MLQALEIRNFLKLRAVKLDLSGAPVHFFSGKNEAGKSSLAEAIRFALLGSSPRIGLKKNYPMLVTDGVSQESSVRVAGQGWALARSTRSGAVTEGEGIAFSERVATVLSFVLGVRRFYDLDPSERRAVLFAAMNVGYDREEIAKRMAQREISQPTIALLSPYLRSGFEAAENAAKTKQSEARGAWTQVTGEAFGASKAAGWAKESPRERIPDARIAELTASIHATATRFEELNRQIGASQSRAAEADRLIARKQALQTEIDSLQIMLDNGERLVEEEDRLADQVRRLTEDVQAAQRAAKMLACPACDTLLRLDEQNWELEVGDPDALDANTDELPGKRAALAAVTKTRDNLKREIHELNQRIAAARAASAMAAEITGQLEKLASEQVASEGLHDALDELVIEQSQLRSAYQQAQSINAEHAAAEQVTKQAQEWLARWLDYDKAAKALAPDGIQAELLREALDPFNAQMAASAAVAGWEPVAIRGDMRIMRGDVDYSLLSESARFRADLLLNCALARNVDLKLLVIDRIDVLDVENRAALLTWLNDARAYFTTILCMATLKEQPRMAMDWIRSYWLEDGLIRDDSETAAPVAPPATKRRKKA